MFNIDIMSRQPIYEQLVGQIEKYVLGGLLSPGDKIPSVRTLSIELSINPNTIQKAYSELDNKGIICSVPGKGCFIADGAKAILDQREREKFGELKILIKQMFQAGIAKADIDALVEETYEEVNNT